MSQERTRFPIQPKERRRSARSSRDVHQAPEEMPPPARGGRKTGDPDKPAYPPHERHRHDRDDS